MPVSATPTLQQVIAEFNGPSNLTAYVRGGAYVPNTVANQAVSTTAAGLALSQFANASANSLPPAPSVTDLHATATISSPYGSVDISASVGTNGTIYIVTSGDTYDTGGVYCTWLPSGRTASEYQLRMSTDGSTWSAWQSITTDISIGGAGAVSDPQFYSSGYSFMYVQFGASGQVLTSFTCELEAH